MMQARALRLAASLLALVLLPAWAAAAGRGPAPAPEGRGVLPGVVIVKLRARIPTGGAARMTGMQPVDVLLGRHTVRSIAPVAPVLAPAARPSSTDLSRVYVVRFADGTDPRRLARRLAELPGVEYAEPQYVYPLDVVPNDPYYSQQYLGYAKQSPYLTRMRFPPAWDRVKGEQGGVVVAIVDGGTDWRHPDLADNIWSNPGEIPDNGIDDDANGFVDDVHGWNFTTGSGDPTGLPTAPESGNHGTHTAGIVCARADNALGIAGASWNARVMPICAASPTADRQIAFGYEGILYAANNGANIISCSWGGLNGSSFELDVITYAWEHDCAVLAAAGNNASSDKHYPASYPHVLSVANVDNNDFANPSTNFGPTVDVSAQGTAILSTVPETIPGMLYGVMTGTSMSSPHAAAVCALVKTRWPGYTADQVMERVRVTADTVIDYLNPTLAGSLGHGRVDAFSALTKNTPAVRITGIALHDANANGILEPDEIVTVELRVTNFLARVSGLSCTLTSPSRWVEVTNGTTAVAALDSMESVVMPALVLHILPGVPVQQTVLCGLTIRGASPAYRDQDHFEITVLPIFATHDANNVVTSVTSVGRLGFALVAGGDGTDGVGFRYKGGGQLLYEGALMMGTSADRVSDGARSADSIFVTQDDDFSTLPGGVPHRSRPGPLADEQSVATFDDSLAPAPLGVHVRQDAFQFANPPDADHLILKYTIRNTNEAPILGLRVGWFFDWDVDSDTFDTNQTGFDPARDLGWVHDTSAAGPKLCIGVRVLTSPGATSYRGIWNDALDPNNPTGWGIYDGFTGAEKWESLSGGIVSPVAGPADVSHAIATGPFDIAARDSIVIGFALVGGDDLAALQVNADAAQAKWNALRDVPVELFDLAATQEGSDVVLRWRAASQEDAAAFRVFRAQEGEAFQPLVPDLAPDPGRTYLFRDRAPTPGRYSYRIGALSPGGGIVLHAGVQIDVVRFVPARSFLDPGVPNPFNPSTRLRFGLAQAGPAELAIYDARGRLVRRLWHWAQAGAGTYDLVWDGRDERGARAPSGIYSARLVAPGRVLTRRLTLLK